MTDRIKVTPVRAANGRIQGWAINQGGRELDFYGVAWCGALGWNPHAQAMNQARKLARGEIR
ncbi:hypothetical protein [Mycobacterium sp. 48b]|uniref:hypothetical protein n=1 Tax=Mycobacterium sp. 48b TaxID=3400426 RepID=UPI003AB0794C